ncbi:MAG TPA: hypothetical protein VIV15_01050 [Anaerolineales bacterium]
MSERSNKKKKKKEMKEVREAMSQPWISMRTGIRVVAVASILMAILTAWQVIPVKGWVEGILWGLLFGALIWVIFFGNIWLNKLFRRK